MLTEDIDRLVDEIRFEIGAPDVTIEHYVRRSIERFCDGSRFWREDLGPVRVVDVTGTYEFSPSRYQTVVNLEGIYTTDDKGESVELAYGENIGDWGYVQDAPGQITVYPHESLIGKDLKIICSLKPRLYNGVFKYESTLADEYEDALIAGAKAYLYRVMNKEWSSPELARVNQSEFEIQINEAKTRALNGFAKTPRRIKHKPRLFY